MLDCHDAQELIDQLPCELELPESAAEYYEKRGVHPTTFPEQRRFPRYYFRTSAAIKPFQVITSCPRKLRPSRVIIKDICRGGIALLHSEQLFPLEQIEVILFDGSAHLVEVTRCRRVGKRCFEVAARFIGKSPPHFC